MSGAFLLKIDPIFDRARFITRQIMIMDGKSGDNSLSRISSRADRISQLADLLNSFSRPQLWLRCIRSPLGMATVLRAVDSLRPILTNAPEYLEQILGFGTARAFRARIRGGPAIEFPPINGLNLLSTNIPLMIRETWLDHLYTPPGFEIRDGENIVDLGANVGVFSLFAALRTPSGQIIAYEPIPELYELLCFNLKMNAVPNVRAFRAGVLDYVGRGSIWYNSSNVGGHSIYAERVNPKDVVRVPVEFTTLDNVIATNSLRTIDLLKADCEGSEYRIFEASSDLSIRRIRRLSIEYHAIPGGTELLSLLVERLSRLGFRVRTMQTGAELGMLWAWHDESDVPISDGVS